MHEHWQHENIVPPNCHSLAIANHFVVYHILQAIRDYFLLLIELELLAPFEYSWVYWLVDYVMA